MLNTGTRNNKSMYLGAYKGSELAAVNFFIGHEMLFNGETHYAHQSCWSATSPDHRKQGLFSQLINTAKERLKSSGSALIFGFPNLNSEPIFTRKLGFRSISMSKVNIPVFGPSEYLLPFFIKVPGVHDVLNTEQTFIPIESEIIELKQHEFDDEVKVYQSYNNIIWGKRVSRKFSFGTFRFFNVGGIQVNKPSLLRSLFWSLIQKENIDFLQIVGVSNSQLWSLFRGVGKAQRIEPLIVYDLNVDSTAAHFNFFTGIKDVF